jgi:transcriptional regulator of met regulon
MAILLLEAEQYLDATNLIDKITSLIDGPIAKLENKAEAIADLTESHKAALECAIVEARSQLHNSSESIERAMANVTMAATQLDDAGTTKARRPEGSYTYANAVQANIPAPLTKILARSEAQTRQILIDRRTTQEVNSLRELTEAELVAKATLTLELIAKEGTEIPPKLSFISARRLPHGGILYELDSTESAKWFETPANRGTFLANFGNNVTIKDRSYNILVENAPITYTPSSRYANEDIEKKGGLKQGSITKAKWIKPIARCNQDQRTAHAILTLKSKECANQILRFGISIEGKKVYGRKLLPEPTRCLKCHTFDGSHAAAKCPQEHDTCGTCAAQHRTSACKVHQQNAYGSLWLYG